MLHFRRERHPLVTPQAFLDFVGSNLPQADSLNLPPITGEELSEVAAAKHSSAGGSDGWAWSEVRALSISWFVGLAVVFRRLLGAELRVFLSSHRNDLLI